MPDKLILQTLEVGQGSLEILNVNFQLIQEAFNNILSRDGTAPNAMGAALDMNSYSIYNLPNAASNSEPIPYGQLLSMATLNLYTPENHVHDWDTQIADKPSTYPPEAHTHSQSEISGLVARLDANDVIVDDLNTRPYIYVQAGTPTTPATNDLWFW